jgi:indolepyruvate ferredoxin oxidoreductase alpha subunit
MGVRVEVTDPFDLQETRQKVLSALEDSSGVKVLIMRRRCQMLKDRDEPAPFNVRIDPEKCFGESCGCNRLCTRVFKCPGLIWDKKVKKARVDEVICVGCGVCADICPQGAIQKERVKN